MHKPGRHLPMAFLAVISGPLASGKTGVCLRLHHRLSEAGYLSSGIVQENSRNGTGFPVSIRFRHLSSGAVWAWTERDPGQLPPAPFDFPDAPLARAAECLSRDAEEGFRPLILDEIGLLELGEKKGFIEWLSEYLRGENAFLVASLRAGREDALIRLLGEKGLHTDALCHEVFRVTKESRETCLDSLYNWVLRHCPKEVGKLYLKQNTIPKR